MLLCANWVIAQKKQTLFIRTTFMHLMPNDENLEVLYKNGYGLQADIGKKWQNTSVSLSVGVHTYASKQGTITINPTTYGKFSGLVLVPVQLNVEQAIIGPWFVGGSFGGVYQQSSIKGMLNGIDVSQKVSSGTAIWEYGTGFQINKLRIGGYYSGFNNQQQDGSTVKSRFYAIKLGWQFTLKK